ncbi:hypothetical protein ACQRIT_002543 [Beauveria bassiana]
MLHLLVCQPNTTIINTEPQPSIYIHIFVETASHPIVRQQFVSSHPPWSIHLQPPEPGAIHATILPCPPTLSRSTQFSSRLPTCHRG